MWASKKYRGSTLISLVVNANNQPESALVWSEMNYIMKQASYYQSNLNLT